MTHVTRAAAARTTETPNAVMTTHASPTLGESAHSLWRVSMPAGGSGPEHVFDHDQTWLVIAGGAEVELPGVELAGAERLALAAGDAVVVPAGQARRIHADAELGLEAIVTGFGASRASMPDGTDRGVPAWIA